MRLFVFFFLFPSSFLQLISNPCTPVKLHFGLITICNSQIVVRHFLPAQAPWLGRHQDKRAVRWSLIEKWWCNSINYILLQATEVAEGIIEMEHNTTSLKNNKWSVCAYTLADPATSPPHKTVKTSVLLPGFYSMRLAQRWVCSSITSLSLPPSISLCLSLYPLFLS